MTLGGHGDDGKARASETNSLRGCPTANVHVLSKIYQTNKNILTP